MPQRFGHLHSFNMRIVIVLVAVQLSCATALILWWAHLLISHSAQQDVARATRMVLLEGGWFLAVIVASTLLLLSMYVRDVRRGRALRSFFAVLTHELKTPLTSVKLQAESINDVFCAKFAHETYLTHLVERLLEDASKLEGQVDQALELARIEGGASVQNETIDLKAIVSKTCRAWIDKESALKTNLSLKIDPNENLRAYADVHALRVVIQNILENSKRHAHVSQLDINVSIQNEPGDRISAVFSDNGQSDPKSLPRRLGNLFAKGLTSRGAGVGLYLIRNLMIRMQGKAEFRREHSGFVVKLFFRASKD